jgi:hypothetical protein
MVRSFTDHPKYAPYQAAVPKIDLKTPNPPKAPLSAESSRMDFSKEDHLGKREGPRKAHPAPKSGAPDDDDD